jgi:hypothetical protein
MAARVAWFTQCKVEQIDQLLDQLNGNTQILCGSNFAELAKYD